MQLEEYDILYKLRQPVNRLVLSNFVQEITLGDEAYQTLPIWQLYIDGPMSTRGLRAKIILLGLGKIQI